jgi:hypothetical protein
VHFFGPFFGGALVVRIGEARLNIDETNAPPAQGLARYETEEHKAYIIVFKMY